MTVAAMKEAVVVTLAETVVAVVLGPAKPPPVAPVAPAAAAAAAIATATAAAARVAVTAAAGAGASAVPVRNTGKIAITLAAEIAVAGPTPKPRCPEHDKAACFMTGSWMIRFYLPLSHPPPRATARQALKLVQTTKEGQEHVAKARTPDTFIGTFMQHAL